MLSHVNWDNPTDMLTNDPDKMRRYLKSGYRLIGKKFHMPKSEQKQTIQPNQMHDEQVNENNEHADENKETQEVKQDKEIEDKHDTATYAIDYNDFNKYFTSAIETELNKYKDYAKQYNKKSGIK